MQVPEAPTVVPTARQLPTDTSTKKHKEHKIDRRTLSYIREILHLVPQFPPDSTMTAGARDVKNQTVMNFMMKLKDNMCKYF